MNIYELCEIQQREGHAFLTGMYDVTFMHVLMFSQCLHLTLAIPTSILHLAKA
jgi:hypothetical protein